MGSLPNCVLKSLHQKISQQKDPPMKYLPDSITISEKSRAILGFNADWDLIHDLQNEGYEPKKFSIGSAGLNIKFELETTKFHALRFEYLCNQEGGNAESFVWTLNDCCSDEGWEVLFAYRVGFKGADPGGVYSRFIARREIKPDKRKTFKYHFAYKNPLQKQVSTKRNWQRICSLPAHEGWQDEYPYALFKEEL